MTISGKLASRCLWWISVAVGSAFVLSCAPTVENRGYLPAVEVLAQIQSGVWTKDDIQVALGTPSSFSMFGAESWYYISSREEKFAFYQPRELERKVIVIRFDDKNMVQEVKTYSLENSRLVEPVPRTTPTSGSEMSVLQQLLGNVGRFNKSRQQGE